MPEPTEVVSIQSIVIGERLVEISYLEPRDQVDSVVTVTTIAVDRFAIEQHYEEFIDAAREVIDAALRLRRDEQLRRG